VDRTTLETRFPGIYAVGDVTSAPVPKAGVFAESAARAVASHIIGRTTRSAFAPFDGRGACYVELATNWWGGSTPTS
jgi:sulfide:quinone oxidoreductase